MERCFPYVSWLEDVVAKYHRVGLRAGRAQQVGMVFAMDRTPARNLARFIDRGPPNQHPARVGGYHVVEVLYAGFRGPEEGVRIIRRGRRIAYNLIQVIHPESRAHSARECAQVSNLACAVP